MYIKKMKPPAHPLPDRIVFIADAHLGLPGETPDRADALVSFLRHIRGTISHLYIVGDLFDFWFEYKSVVPSTTPHVLFELYNIVQDGTRVSIFAGNHDYWLGPYLRDSVGMRLVSDSLTVEHQGKRLYIHHGDGLYPHDHGYRMLKKLLRNRLSIAMFSLIHPDLARGIARLTSATSRRFFAPPPEDKNRNLGLFRDIADNRLAADEVDAAIYGHSHIACMEERPGGTMVLLGDWLEKNTYVTLEDGRFSMHSWDASAQSPVMEDSGK